MPTSLPAIPSRMQNPTGLHHKYNVEKADGSPADPRAEYFVLRLDLAADPKHRDACLRGLSAYADAIEKALPQLARDLRTRYGLRSGRDLFSGYGSAAEVAGAMQTTAGAIEAAARSGDIRDLLVWAVRRA